jgi:hypothetical protein
MPITINGDTGMSHRMSPLINAVTRSAAAGRAVSQNGHSRSFYFTGGNAI